MRDTERRFSPASWWPIHPKDAEGGETDPEYTLYHGACGVIWALRYLDAVGAAQAYRSFDAHLEPLREALLRWHARYGSGGIASYLMGETSFLLLRYGREGRAQDADRLEALIAGNVDDPSRELMWGAPGTMLAALFLHRRTGEARWAELFRGQRAYSVVAARVVAGARVPLLDAGPVRPQEQLHRRGAWLRRDRVAADRRSRAASRGGMDAVARMHRADGDSDGDARRIARQLAPAVAMLRADAAPMLMQYCHGAPGFIVCLGDFPEATLDALLVAGGEAIWAAGPLARAPIFATARPATATRSLRSTGARGDAVWLERARAFAMHAMAQSEADEARFGGLRYSLWTGDPGLAIFLWDCIRGAAAFPTVDVFYAD